MNEAMDNLIQLGRKAEAAAIKVGVIHSKVARLKKYPEDALGKYAKTLLKMHAMVDEMDATAIKIGSKLYDIYYEDMREKFPELEVQGAKRTLRREDGTEIDLTRVGRQPRRRKQRQKAEPKEKFDLEGMF